MQKATQAVSLKLPNVTHMSSNHLHHQVSHQVTSCFIKNNNKIPSNPKHSSPLAQQSLQASARKSHIKLGALWSCSFYAALAPLQRRGRDCFKPVTGQHQSQWLSPPSPVCACVSHTPPPEWLCWSQLSPPACTASLKPLPQLFLPATAGRKQAEATARAGSAAFSSSLWHHHPTTPLIPTPSPASSSGQAFSPFSIIPVICRSPCSLSPEESHQIANVGGSSALSLQGTASQLCHSTEPSYTHPS